MATETSHDVAFKYIETPVNSLPPHKFENYVVGDPDYQDLPEGGMNKTGFLYVAEVYVDDFMSLVIPVTRAQLHHVGNAIMNGIHDISPPNDINNEDPISEIKLDKGEGQYATLKTLLGCDFDGVAKTMWLEFAKQEMLLTTLKGWI